MGALGEWSEDGERRGGCGGECGSNRANESNGGEATAVCLAGPGGYVIFLSNNTKTRLLYELFFTFGIGAGFGCAGTGNAGGVALCGGADAGAGGDGGVVKEGVVL